MAFLKGSPPQGGGFRPGKLKLNGQLGLLFFDYTVEGAISTSGSGSSAAELLVDVRADFPGCPTSTGFCRDQIYYSPYTSSISGQFGVTQGFSFIFGQPFNIGFCLGAGTGSGIVPAGPTDGHITTNICAPGPEAIQTGNGTGTANFNWTLSGITLTDSAGHPVSDATFTSASGTQYGPNGVVPEPGSLLLLGLGLVIVAARRPNSFWRFYWCSKGSLDKPSHGRGGHLL